MKKTAFRDYDAKSPTLLSLFAGCGGLDIGLERAGFTTLAANDVQPYACETLRANQLLPTLAVSEFEAWFTKQMEQRCYSGSSDVETRTLRRRIETRRTGATFLSHAKILEGDIRGFSSTALAEAAGVRRGALTLVAGGPPCQPFSRAGKRETVEVADGRLFLEFVRIVRDLRPRWFLFENVKGLVLSSTEVLRAECADCHHRDVVPFEARAGFFDGSGSVVFVCSKCGGRGDPVTETKRGGSLDIIVAEFERIGYSTHVEVLNAADFGAPQLRERLIIVGSRDGEHLEWPMRTHSSDGEQHRQQSLFSPRTAVAPWRTMIDTIWSKGHPSFGTLDPERAVLWVKNVVRPHAEPVTWKLDRPAPTIGAHQSAKLAIAPYGVPEEQLRRQQWHVLGRRQGDSPPVHVAHEYLSDVELLDLQTFPSEWYLYGTRMQRAFQIGNAVPVVLGHALGQAIIGSQATSAQKAPTNGDGHHAADAPSVQQRRV